MVTTRTLHHRRQLGGGARYVPARRRSGQAELGRLAGLAARGLRLGSVSRAYLALAPLAGLALAYLLLTAQATTASYQIEQLHAQQDQLKASQADLLYREAELKAPANVDAQASQAGLQRLIPVRYLTGQAVSLNLEAPIGAAPLDSRPLWRRWLDSWLRIPGVQKAG